MKDYHDLYLESDALLLADVPEKFRNNSLKFFLCLSNYFSAPSLSQNAIHSMAKVIDLISDADVYLSVRGQVSYISKRYSKGYNKYLKSYDPKQESKLILICK